MRQSIGEPNRFRLRHRDALRTVVGDAVRARLDRKAAAGHVAAWAATNIEEGDQAEFREVAENDLLGLHQGNVARYAIRPVEFTAWRAVGGGRG